MGLVPSELMQQERNSVHCLPFEFSQIFLFNFSHPLSLVIFTILIATFLIFFWLWKWSICIMNTGSRRETFHSWQRSWGRRLGIRKGGIEPSECPWIFSSIYPQKPESAYFIVLCSHLWLYWGLSPTTISLSLSKS